MMVNADIGRTHFSAMDGEKRAAAVNAVRTSLLQGLGGAVLLLGAFFTWRQLQVTREGHLSERFVQAVEQLGHKELDVQIGGIYTLARIAKVSREDREAIVEVLTAYVRQHSVPKDKTELRNLPWVPTLRTLRPSVQAAMSILGARIPPPEGGWRLILYNVDLRNCSFRRANLEGASLDGALLHQSHFNGAVARGASFRRAFLIAAHLQGANLRDADLNYAVLDGADLTDADLQGANVRGAILKTAKNLHAANLTGAKASSHTEWPRGFDWKAAQVIDTASS